MTKPARTATAKATANGWKTCVRGHKYRGQVCARCWPAGAARAKAKRLTKK